MKEYCIIEDIFDKDTLASIYKKIANPQLYWQFRTHTCDRITDGAVNYEYTDFGAITYSILQTKEEYETEDTELWSKIFPILKNQVEKNFDVSVVGAYRSQINLTFPHPAINKPMAPHPDGRNPRRDPLNLHGTVEKIRQISVNIFLNEVIDGEFVLFNEAHTPWQGGKIDLSVKDKIPSKENRAVIFDSSLFHAGTLSSNTHRLISNTIINVIDK